MKKSHLPLFVLAALATTLSPVFAAAVPVPSWRHLTSREGDLPVPNGGKEQTTAVIFDVDGDGVNDFVLGERTAAPGVIWMRRTATGWEKYLVDDGARRTEAGGLSYDVDGDGDPDFIVGGDAQSDEIWWYENPRPIFHPATPWKRHLIKQGGGMAHHDQAMADFKKTGRPQLMFWNQKVQKLLLADMPADPRHSGPWPIAEIMDVAKVTTVLKQEGITVADIDNDKRPDLLAGNFWFKHIKDNEFKPIQFADHPGRVAAGWFKPGKYPQIVLSSGDGDAPLTIYECGGDPTDPKAWKGRDLLGTTMIHGHSIDVADINGDGHLDIFTAEMALWKRGAQVPDNPTARAWILYGDGEGNFTTTILSTGVGFHEAKVADLDGDGKLDILNKPYHWDTPRVDVWLNRGNHRNIPAGNFAGPLSMELWTYRDALNQDLVGTLSMIRRRGFTDIETSRLYGKTPAEFRHILDQVGLTCSSLITSLDAITKDVEAAAADAKTLGAGYVIISHLVPHQQKVITMDDIKRAAADFNRWGAALKKHGLKFAYHPHGREFIRTADGNYFDELLKLTDPELVTFEMDMFWFWHSGADPVAYLKQHPRRFELMHLKDGRKGTPTGEPTGIAPNPTSVAFGTGMLDFPTILRAAAEAGIKRYYIEDESPYSAQQMRASQEYLRTVKF